MGELRIPFGRSHLSCVVSDDRKVTILRPAENFSEAAEAFGGTVNSSEEAAKNIIQAALDSPISSPPLSQLAVGKKQVVVITSDHTRPVPSHLTLPPMLAEIRRGSPAANITVLIAVGSHRGTTHAEMVEKFGADFVAKENIINHDPHDESSLSSLGHLPSGGELIINRLAAQADLLVADGFIEPHQVAGFSGGRKSILPGVASLTTVLASHNAEFTGHPLARPGVLAGNPFQIDMLHAAQAASLAFILNVTLNSHKKVAAAFAGNFEKAHLAGCQLVLEQAGVAAVLSPIVITSNGGYPLDQNLYQSTKSISAADLTCAPGGVIIAVNECADGHGGESFYQAFKRASSPEKLLAEIRGRNREQTQPEQWAPQLLAHVTTRHKVIFVSTAPAEVVEIFGLTPAATLEQALQMADDYLGVNNSPITVLPEALGLIITPSGLS